MYFHVVSKKKYTKTGNLHIGKQTKHLKKG